MARTIVVTVGGHTLTSDIVRIDTVANSKSVGLCTLIVLNEANEWGGDFEPKDAILISEGGNTIFTGYVDNATPFNHPQFPSLPMTKIVGRDYAFDLAVLSISKTYTQDEIDDIVDDALSTASAEVTYTSGTTGPITNYTFKRTYLLTAFRELCKRYNYDFYVAQDKALHFFPVADGDEYLDGGGGRADVDLDLVAGSTTNNILKIGFTERLGFDIANYVEVSSGSLRDHWTEGNSTNSVVQNISDGAYTECAIVAAAKTFTANGGSPFSVLTAGDAIVVSNATDDGNNGNYTVASITGSDRILTVNETVTSDRDPDQTIIISFKGHWIPENEDCQVDMDTGFPATAQRGNSLKITTDDNSQEIGAYIDLATVGYGGTTVDLSNRGEGYYQVYYTSTDNNISIRPYMEDADGEVIEFYRTASQSANKGLTEAITKAKWRRVYFTHGVPTEDVGDIVSEVEDTEGEARTGRWFYVSGSSFDFSAVAKIGIRTKKARNANTVIYIDDLTIPAIEVFRIEQDATSISNYGKRMIHRSRQDLVSQLEVNDAAEGLLAKRKDIMQTVAVIVDGNTDILYPGQSLDVNAPPYGINSDTKYRILRLRHTIIAKRGEATIKGWDYTTTLDLTRDNVQSDYDRSLRQFGFSQSTINALRGIRSVNDHLVGDDPSQWSDDDPVSSRWTTNLGFTWDSANRDWDEIWWGQGGDEKNTDATLVFEDGRSVGINKGTTDALADDTHYFYWDETQKTNDKYDLQTTTTYSTAIGLGKGHIATVTIDDGNSLTPTFGIVSGYTNTVGGTSIPPFTIRTEHIDTDYITARYFQSGANVGDGLAGFVINPTEIAGYDGGSPGVKQFYVTASDGIGYFGGGTARLDVNGMILKADSTDLIIFQKADTTKVGSIGTAGGGAGHMTMMGNQTGNIYVSDAAATSYLKIDDSAGATDGRVTIQASNSEDIVLVPGAGDIQVWTGDVYPQGTDGDLGRTGDRWTELWIDNVGSDLIPLTDEDTDLGSSSLIWDQAFLKNWVLDISPDSDLKGHGITITDTVGENVTFGDMLYLKSDGKWWQSDADAEATMPIGAMALGTINANNSGSLLLYGVARDDSWNWTIGALLYASTNTAALTETQPAGSGDQVQVVAEARTADVIIFRPSAVLVEIV